MTEQENKKTEQEIKKPVILELFPIEEKEDGFCEGCKVCPEPCSEENNFNLPWNK